MTSLDMDRWDAGTFKDVIKSVYERKLFYVEDRHGKNEAGIDLLAKKYSADGAKVLETVGVQVTKGKADKHRLENASFALSQNRPVDLFLIYALKGKAQDFDSYLDTISEEKRRKIRVKTSQEIEEEVLETNCTPDAEFEFLFKEFYRSSAFNVMKKISKIIKQGDNVNSTIADFRRLASNHRNVESELKGLLRSFQDLQSTASSIRKELLTSLRNDRGYIATAKNGFESLGEPLSRISSRMEYFEDHALVKALLWKTLANSFRSTLRHSLEIKDSYFVKAFWLYHGFDPEESIYRGTFCRDLILGVFFSLDTMAQYLKGYVDHILTFDLASVEELKSLMAK